MKSINVFIRTGVTNRQFRAKFPEFTQSTFSRHKRNCLSGISQDKAEAKARQKMMDEAGLNPVLLSFNQAIRRQEQLAIRHSRAGNTGQATNANIALSRLLIDREQFRQIESKAAIGITDEELTAWCRALTPVAKERVKQLLFKELGLIAPQFNIRFCKPTGSVAAPTPTPATASPAIVAQSTTPPAEEARREADVQATVAVFAALGEPEPLAVREFPESPEAAKLTAILKQPDLPDYVRNEIMMRRQAIRGW